MEGYKERVIIKTHYKNTKCFTEIIRKLRGTFGKNESSIRLYKIEEIGFILKKRK